MGLIGGIKRKGENGRNYSKQLLMIFFRFMEVLGICLRKIVRTIADGEVISSIIIYIKLASQGITINIIDIPVEGRHRIYKGVWAG